MNKFLGVVMDPIESLSYHKDTTSGIAAGCPESWL